MLATFAPLTVVPDTTTYELLLTLTTPLSHHDAAVQDDSNRMLFNRQKHLLAGPTLNALPDQRAIDALAAAHPVPASMADLVRDLSFAEFIATALCRTFLDCYNSQDGSGLFSGLERYARLEARLHQSAVGSHGLRGWWDALCRSMQVSIHSGDGDLALLRLLTVPSGLQQLVLRVLVDDYRSVVAMARLWHSTAKLASAQYAEKTGQAVQAETEVLRWDAGQLAPGSDLARVLEVPCISGNSLRHQVVREPSWLHLCAQLGIRPDSLPAGVEAMFYNGGNIRAGAKAPTNEYAIKRQVRQLYPSLDLLGGVADSFDLGESRLQVAGWLVCRENQGALADSAAADLPAATVSAFDLLDDVTLTRQAGLTGVGQMIYSLESLCVGTQVLVRLNLSLFTPALVQGALVAAVETFLWQQPTLGGQAARGFGHARGEWLRQPGERGDALRLEYESYLAAGRDMLLDGLTSGKLGTALILAS